MLRGGNLWVTEHPGGGQTTTEISLTAINVTSPSPEYSNSDSIHSRCRGREHREMGDSSPSPSDSQTLVKGVNRIILNPADSRLAPEFGIYTPPRGGDFKNSKVDLATEVTPQKPPSYFLNSFLLLSLERRMKTCTLRYRVDLPSETRKVVWIEDGVLEE